MKRYVMAAGGLSCLLMLLAGCADGNSYTKEQESRITEQGRPILEEFLAALPAKEITTKACYMMPGIEEGSLPYGGDFLSDVVKMEFTADGVSYSAAVDLSSGIVYSDYYMFDMDEQVKRQLLPYCEKYGYTGELTVGGVEVMYTIHCPEMVNGNGGKGVRSYVEIREMIPALYSEEDVTERAEHYLHDAPLDGFVITYEISSEEYLDPGILVDYLEDTGNYRMEETRNTPFHSYQIRGKREYEEYPEEGVTSYEMELVMHEGPHSMTYDLRRGDALKIDEFCFAYVGASKEGTMESFYDDAFTEYELPIEVEDGRVSYHGSKNAVNARMFFEEEPPYTDFRRICYENNVKQAEEKLILAENEAAGTYYLTLEAKPQSISGAYPLDREQDIFFAEKQTGSGSGE